MFKIGQEVRMEIDDQRKGQVSYGFIIGRPKGMPDVVVVSTQQIIGCPINIKWCEERENFDYDLAMWCRKRYENMAPDYLESI